MWSTDAPFFPASAKKFNNGTEYMKLKQKINLERGVKEERGRGQKLYMYEKVHSRYQTPLDLKN